MATNWNDELLEQLTWHWNGHVRPRLDGLTDDEYLWEPVVGCWSIRPRAEATTPMAAGAGDHVADYAFPEPDPSPFTTIAWRLGHVVVGVFGARNASHFGGPPMDYATAEWAPDAETALAQLDDGCSRWVEGVTSRARPASPNRWARPKGPSPSTPSRRSSCTSTVRSSTTSPRC